MGSSCVWLQDIQMHEASEAATAAHHEPAMGLFRSSADETSVSHNQGVSEPAALQEVLLIACCRSEDPVAA